MQNSGPRFQSSLGRKLKRRYKESQNIDRLSLARVVGVNYKYNTVDVVTDKGGFSSAAEGRYAAKMPILFGGRNLSGYEFGQVNPIAIGSLVLVGFVEGEKVSPIVIGVYSDLDEANELARTKLTSSGPLDRELSRETLQQFTLHPSLTYENIDGKGNIFKTLPGMTFITAESGADPELGGPSDAGNGTSYDELPTSYYNSGELIVPEELRAPSILFKHEGGRVEHEDLSFKTDDHVFMWFLDERGNHRKTVLSDVADWKTFHEMDTQGNMRLKHQKETKETNKSREYNEILLGAEGSEMRVERGSSGKKNSIELTEGGLLIVIDSRGERQEIQLSPSGMDMRIKDIQIEVSSEGLDIEDLGGARIQLDGADIELSSEGTTLKMSPGEFVATHGGRIVAATGGVTNGELMIPENRKEQMDENTEEIAKIWAVLGAPE